jgi:hypothetical protein
MKVLERYSGECAEGTPEAIEDWKTCMTNEFGKDCDFVDCTDMTELQYKMTVDDMNRMNSWASVKNPRGYIGSVIDNRAEELGFTRDYLTFEYSSGNMRSHGFIKGKKGIVVKGNVETGEITVKED